VVPWFQMMSRANAFPTWVAFTRALELEFGPFPYEVPRSTLFKLTQTGSVQDYYTQFTALANRVQGVTTEALLDCFVGGLKPDIRRDVIAQAPTILLHSVSLAKLYEEKYVPKPRPSYPQFQTKTQTPNTSQQVTQSLKSTNLPPLLLKPVTNQKNTNIKRITTAEMQLRREKGLCFTCDEKFSSSHRCPNKQYLFLQLEDEENVDIQPEPPDISDLVDHLHVQEHHLSYNALKGSFGVGTMRFYGSIKGMQVQVLLDSGSSDNFLQPRITQCLKLSVKPIPDFQVLVGNGNALIAEGLIKELEVTIQGHSLKLPVYLLPVSGADLVLGAAWLATLGAHISDYSKLVLKFCLGNQFVTLQGEQTKLPTQAQFNHMCRMHQTNAIDELFTLQVASSLSPVDQGIDIPTNLDPEVAILLYTYNEVFAIPRGLPPPRSQNHAIPLLLGSRPVKVRPYRYPHSQKLQIEKMIKEMLEGGIIVPALALFLPLSFW